MSKNPSGALSGIGRSGGYQLSIGHQPNIDPALPGGMHRWASRQGVVEQHSRTPDTKGGEHNEILKATDLGDSVRSGRDSGSDQGRFPTSRQPWNVASDVLPTRVRGG
jgi:hypothetical protein